MEGSSTSIWDIYEGRRERREVLSARSLASYLCLPLLVQNRSDEVTHNLLSLLELSFTSSNESLEGFCD